jgi:hypothetical protein
MIDNILLPRPEVIKAKYLSQHLCFCRHHFPFNDAVDIR